MEPARPVNYNSEDAGVGQTTGRWVALRPDAGRVRPVSADVRRIEEMLRDQTLVESGRA